MIVRFGLLNANEWQVSQFSLSGKELGGKGSEDSKTLKDAHILVSRNPTSSARNTKDKFAHDLQHGFDLPHVEA